MPSLPKVTVVTVVYNAADEIEKTIQSVISQSYPDVEYIVVDGASTDGTTEIIKKYADKISLFISEPDKGIYDAMNKGIRHATGEWINFMNAGDYFYSPESVSEMFGFSENAYKDYAVVYGDAEFRLKNFSYVLEALPSQSDRFMPFSHQAAFTRVGLAKKNGFNMMYKIAADSEFFLRLIREGFEFNRIPVVVCAYDSSRGISAQNEVLRSKEFVDMQVRYGADANSPYYKKFIRDAKIKQFMRKIFPDSVWIKMRERKVKKQLGIK